MSDLPKCIVVEGHYKRYKDTEFNNIRRWLRKGEIFEYWAGGDNRFEESVYYGLVICKDDDKSYNVYYTKEQFNKYFLAGLKNIRKCKLERLKKISK